MHTHESELLALPLARRLRNTQMSLRVNCNCDSDSRSYVAFDFFCSPRSLLLLQVESSHRTTTTRSCWLASRPAYQLHAIIMHVDNNYYHTSDHHHYSYVIAVLVREPPRCSPRVANELEAEKTRSNNRRSHWPFAHSLVSPLARPFVIRIMISPY